MARITVTKEARKDLEQIRNYIRDELLNPTAEEDRWMLSLRCTQSTVTLSVRTTASFICPTKRMSSLCEFSTSARTA